MPSASPTSVVDDEGNSSAKNSYLALRAANIARNEARLRELGLLRSSNSSVSTRSRPQIQTRKENNAKSSGKEQNQFAVVRRSSRLKKTGPESCWVVSVAPRKNHKRKSAPTKENTMDETTIENSSAQVTSYSDMSARSISIDVHKLVLGQSGFLAQQMKATGKGFVMQETVRLCSDRNFSGDIIHISFNKYCGAQEWKNDAIFLWVNLGGNGNDFTNQFLDSGRKITWFGGSRMHNETSVIKRLIKIGKAAATDSLERSNGIVLWVRQPCPEKKGVFGPYICLGRLSYSSHEADFLPISFVWNLLDHDLLMSESSGALRQIVGG